MKRFIWILVIPSIVALIICGVGWYLDMKVGMEGPARYWVIGFFGGYLVCFMQAVAAHELN